MKTLNLILKKKWYDLIKQGIKLEEYRDIKPYYSKKFLYGCVYCEGEECTNKCIDFAIIPEKYNIVKLRLGYTDKYMLYYIDKITIGKGKEAWGAEPDKLYFVIRLGKRIL